MKIQDNYRLLLVFFTLTAVLFACDSPKEINTDSEEVAETTAQKYVNLENEDSIKLTEIKEYQGQIEWSIVADIETDPVSANSEEDAADDPAIWIKESNPSESIVFGSNKRGGIVAYNLAGKELNYYPIGRVNNVDILQPVSAADSSRQVLGCSNRTTQSIDLFFVEQNGDLTAARTAQLKLDSTVIDDVYGFCFGTDVNTTLDYVFVNGKNGNMLQFLMTFEADTIALEQVRLLNFGDQTEGMIADNSTAMLYVGAENTGVWKLPIDPLTKDSMKLIAASSAANKNIRYDVEGLTIASYKEQHILMVSSQGNFTYALFNLSDQDKYLGSFKIIDDAIIDGTEDTDGIDVKMDSLNETFTNGIFVVQDGYNFKGDTLKAQNFKLIDFRKIQQLLDEVL